jgi:dTDP-4-dehydrorhamnose reductase
VEDMVRSISIPAVSIFRPSMLLGKREESRPAESVVQTISKSLSFLFPAQYKPIAAETVAKAMIEACKQDKPGFNIYHFKEMKAFQEACKKETHY